MTSPMTTPAIPTGSTHYLPETDTFRSHFIRVIGGLVLSKTGVNKRGEPIWSDLPLRAKISDYLIIAPVINVPAFEVIHDEGEVEQLLCSSDYPIMCDYASSDLIADHKIDFAFASLDTGEYIGGVSAQCGKDNNSRGTGFTLNFNCIHINEDFQGLKLARNLVEQTIENALTYYPFENTPNETCIEFSIASEKGAHCAWKLYQALKLKLMHTKTKVRLWAEGYGYVASRSDLSKAIEKIEHC